MTFEPVPNAPDSRYYRAQLPDGSWGLFWWNPETQTMFHEDTLDDPIFWPADDKNNN